MALEPNAPTRESVQEQITAALKPLQDEVAELREQLREAKGVAQVFGESLRAALAGLDQAQGDSGGPPPTRP